MEADGPLLDVGMSLMPFVVVVDVVDAICRRCRCRLCFGIRSLDDDTLPTCVMLPSHLPTVPSSQISTSLSEQLPTSSPSIDLPNLVNDKLVELSIELSKSSVSKMSDDIL